MSFGGSANTRGKYCLLTLMRELSSMPSSMLMFWKVFGSSNNAPGLLS